MTENTSIPGLTLLPNFITEEEEQSLLTTIDNENWDTTLRRRVQHYGYRYDYRKRSANNESYLGPMPEWATSLCKKVAEIGVFPKTPQQLIINEYVTTQGISWHTDAATFGPVIGTLSLLETWEMELSRSYKPGKPSNIISLPKRSLTIMEGIARYKYFHRIPSRIEEPVFDENSHLTGFNRRCRRISVTFRTMVT